MSIKKIIIDIAGRSHGKTERVRKMYSERKIEFRSPIFMETTNEETKIPCIPKPTK